MEGDLPSLLEIVLVESQFGGNIGSAARAMTNFGLSRLTLVNPAPGWEREARIMGVHADSVLETVRLAGSIEAAVDGCGLVVGTTARTRRKQERFVPVTELAGKIGPALAGGNRVAVLFGPERTGLTNEALNRCNWFVTIPTADFSSLNVAHAVLVVVWELAGRPIRPVFKGRTRKIAPADELEGFYDHWRQTLESVGYRRTISPDYWMMLMRRLFGKAAMTEQEVRMMRGVCRKVLHAAGQSPSPPAPLPEGEGEPPGGG